MPPAVRVTCLLAVLALAVPLTLVGPAPAASAEPVYGSTLTNAASWGNYAKVVRGSKEALGFGRRLTHRIVFDPGTKPADYAPAINALRPHSNILGELVDSYSVRDYTRREYLARTNRYLKVLGARIDIYEIGNEINGEWLGRGAAAKAHDAFHAVDDAGHDTALTAYYNPRCWSRRSHRMLPWLRKNIPADMRSGVDYLLVSYYERDCNNHRVRQKEMDRVFGRLHRMFPDAKLGWGEVGLRGPVRGGGLRTAKSLLTHYYGLKPAPASVPPDRYVTGGFWWFAQQDLYPVSRKRLWRTFRRAILAY